MAQKPRLGAAYDFRNPSRSGMTASDFQAAIMDQVIWLDGLGFDLIWFTEHHFVDDGYRPSWIPVASAGSQASCRRNAFRKPGWPAMSSTMTPRLRAMFPR